MTDKTGILVGLLGLAVTIGSGWYIVRGPFFGYEIPTAEYMLAASGVFIVAMYMFAWGLDRIYREQGTERPEITEEQDQTMDTPFGPR